MTRIVMPVRSRAGDRPLHELIDLLQRKVITDNDLNNAEFDAVMRHFVAIAQKNIEAKEAIPTGASY